MIGFLLPHVVVAATVAAYRLDRPWAFALPAWVYFAGMFVDQLAAARETAVLVPHSGRRFWRVVVYAWAPLHLLALGCGLHALVHLPAAPGAFWSGLMALAVSLGMIGGMFGSAIAHELMHAPRTADRVLGAGLMSLITYGHFSIGHVAGHHRWVGTPGDSATARRGESLYAFLVRALAGGVRLAWRAERTRLRRHRQPLWSAQNRVLQILAWQALVYAAIQAAVGPRGVLFFALQSLVGVGLLEVMNYVMHYGLRRVQLSSGRFEPVRPQVSWNTRRLATTYLLCGVGLHSYHHCRPSKPFPRLMLPAAAPQLPAGLFAMFVLAWFPPLWRAIMDPLADLWMRPAPVTPHERPARIAAGSGEDRWSNAS